MTAHERKSLARADVDDEAPVGRMSAGAKATLLVAFVLSLLNTWVYMIAAAKHAELRQRYEDLQLSVSEIRDIAHFLYDEHTKK